MERLKLPQASVDNGLSWWYQKSVFETFRPHAHEYHELFYVYAGAAIHNVNGTSELIGTNTFKLIRPDDWHSYTYFKKNGFELLSMAIEIELFDRTCELIGVSPEYFDKPKYPLNCVLEGKELVNIGEMLKRIVLYPYGEERKRYCKAILPYILFSFVRNDGSAEKSAEKIPNWLSVTIDKMDSEENLCRGIDAMIAISDRTQEHLTRQFKKYIGMTPSEYINIKRIEKAAELLLNTDMPVIDISLTVGYQTLTYFNRLFKKTYGCSPSVFRKKIEK